MREDRGRPEPPTVKLIFSFPVWATAVFSCGCVFIGLIMCLSISYAEHFDLIKNYTWCPGEQNEVSSISMSIGVWTPERYIWLFLIVIHLPPRIYVAFFYYHLYDSSTDKNAKRWVYKWAAKLMVFYHFMELSGVLILTIVDIQYSFSKHRSKFIQNYKKLQLLLCLVHNMLAPTDPKIYSIQLVFSLPLNGNFCF